MKTFFILSGILFWCLIIALSVYVFISDYDYRKTMKKSEKKVEEWLEEQEKKEVMEEEIGVAEPISKTFHNANQFEVGASYRQG